MKRLLVGLAAVGILTIAVPVGSALADVGTAENTAASCMGIEAAVLSPPGSSEESPDGMPGLRRSLDEAAPGVPPGQAFYSVAARLHEGSHEECDVALG